MSGGRSAGNIRGASFEKIRLGIIGLGSHGSGNAMRLSARTGREVELPFNDKEYYRLLMERVKTSRWKENVTAVITDLSDTYNTQSEKK